MSHRISRSNTDVYPALVLLYMATYAIHSTFAWTYTISRTPTINATYTFTHTPSKTSTVSKTKTATITGHATRSYSSSPTFTRSSSQTVSPSSTPSSTRSVTHTHTPSVSHTSSNAGITLTRTPTRTRTASKTPSATGILTISVTPTDSVSTTSTNTVLPTLTVTTTVTSTISHSITPIPTYGLCQNNSTNCVQGTCDTDRYICVCHFDPLLGYWAGKACNQCAVNYYGSDCRTYCLAEEHCSGHGTCGSDGLCDCYQTSTQGFWMGTSCDRCSPEYYGVGNTPGCTLFCNPMSTCSGHGYCDSDGSCTCLQNNVTGYWDGLSCTDCTDEWVGTNCANACDSAVLCSGHGTCVADESSEERSPMCDCYSDTTRGFWDPTTQCTTCVSGYLVSEGCVTHETLKSTPPTPSPSPSKTSTVTVVIIVLCVLIVCVYIVCCGGAFAYYRYTNSKQFQASPGSSSQFTGDDDLFQFDSLRNALGFGDSQPNLPMREYRL